MSIHWELRNLTCFSFFLSFFLFLVTFCLPLDNSRTSSIYLRISSILYTAVSPYMIRAMDIPLIIHVVICLAYSAFAVIFPGVYTIFTSACIIVFTVFIEKSLTRKICWPFSILFQQFIQNLHGRYIRKYYFAIKHFFSGQVDNLLDFIKSLNKWLNISLVLYL